MTDQQPEALLLAECLEQHEYCTLGQMDRAAAELRRLHEVEQQRAELLEALKEITPNMPPPDAPCHYGIVPQSSCLRCQRIARARAAIAKVEGKS